MKYVYKYLPEEYHITILASHTQEDEALKRDADEIGANLLIYKSSGKDHLYGIIFKELWKNNYDLIQSHGFISGTHVYFANLLFRRPHVLTIHGILENKYLTSKTARIKERLLTRILRNVDVIYAVSDDILGHLHENIPSLERAKCTKVVIKNGIDASLFSGDGFLRGYFRQQSGLSDDIFLIGFLGRFMQQKGFNFLIDACEIIEKDFRVNVNYKVLAVGSGDYLDWYKKIIKSKNLEHRFVFIPFQEDVSVIYKDLDVVVMPSLWEACPLQPMEAMCAGTPLIVSNCIGLRETVKDTPAIVFESKNSKALAEAIYGFLENPQKTIFKAFRPTAIKKYDVRKTAEEVHMLFESIVAQ